MRPRPSAALLALAAASHALGQACPPSLSARSIPISRPAAVGHHLLFPESRLLRPIDLTDPTRPQQGSLLPLPKPALLLQVAGNVGAVSYADHTLSLLNLGDPSAPALGATLDPSGLLDTFALSPERLVMSVSSSIFIADIHDLSNPILRAAPGITGVPLGVCGRVALVDDGSVTRVLDLTDIAQPRALAPLPHLAQVAVFGPSVFGQGFGAGVTAWSFADPAAPVQLGTLPGEIWGADGDHTLFLSNTPAEFGARVMDQYDVSDPGSPVLVSRRAHGGFGVVAGAFAGVVLANDPGGGWAEMPEGLPPAIVPVSPSVTTTATAVAFADGLLLVGAGTLGVRAYDLADPANPQLRGTLDTPGSPVGLASSGRTVYIADRTGGLHVADFSNPASPRLIASPITGGSVGDVVRWESMLAVADRTSSVRLFDLANPAAPAPVATIPGGANAVGLGPGTLWAGGTAATRVYSLSDPANPTLTASLGGLGSLCISGGEAFVCFLPSTLSRSDALTGRGLASAVQAAGFPTLQGGFLWVGAGGTITLRDPVSLRDQASATAAGTIADIASSPDLVGVACSTSFRLYRAAAPTGVHTTPGAFRCGHPGNSAALLGGRLIGLAGSGLSTADITRAGSWAPSGSLALPATARSVAVRDDGTGIAATDRGVTVFHSGVDGTLTGLADLPLEFAWRVSVGTHAAVAQVHPLGARTAVVRLDDPQHPAVASTLNFAAEVLATDGDLLALAGGGGLRLYRTTDPSAPELLAERTDLRGGTPSSLLLWGGRLALSPVDGGLILLDITDPRAPRTAWTLPDFRGNFFRQGDRLVGVERDATGEAPIIDWSDLDHPALASHWTPPQLSGGGEVIAAGGGRAVVSGAVADFPMQYAPAASAFAGPGPTFTMDPMDLESCAGSAAALTVAVDGPATLQWFKDGDIIPGATGATLQFPALRARDAGVYTCLAEVGPFPCDRGWSGSARVTICAADANCDGMVDFFDYIDFVDWFEAGDPRADANGDDFLDLFDYLEFVEQFETGC